MNLKTRLAKVEAAHVARVRAAREVARQAQSEWLRDNLGEDEHDGYWRFLVKDILNRCEMRRRAALPLHPYYTDDDFRQLLKFHIDLGPFQVSDAATFKAVRRRMPHRAEWEAAWGAALPGEDPPDPEGERRFDEWIASDAPPDDDWLNLDLSPLFEGQEIEP